MYLVKLSGSVNFILRIISLSIFTVHIAFYIVHVLLSKDAAQLSQHIYINFFVVGS